MEDLAHTHNFVCVTGEPCRRYAAGHHTHWIHRGQVARTPEHFRDAIVRTVDAHRVDVAFLDGLSNTYWNHEALDTVLGPGDPVSVHTRHHLLLAADRWFNVAETPDF